MAAWIILFSSIFLALYYAKLFGNLAKIWRIKTIESTVLVANYTSQVSIIIAYRNETTNLNNLIQSLALLQYPKSQFEILFINDNSTDQSASELKSLLDTTALDYTLLNSVEIGKKAALHLGVSKAKYNQILFTDADVEVQPNWIQAMLSAQTSSTKMVCGPVLFKNNTGFFNKWKQLEFIGLMSSGAAYIAANKPIMANGANLLIDKSTYLQINSNVKTHGADYASGDDVFLLHNLHAQQPGSIAFAFNKQAIVSTNSPEDFKSFINQRLRWASKAKGYKNTDSLFLSLFIALFHLGLVLFFILSFWKFYFIPAWMILLTTKFFSDYRFFKNCLPFFGLQDVRYNYLLSVLMHIFYILVIGFLSLFVSATWKGRKI